MVTAEDVLSIYKLFAGNDIRVWIMGGWGIDALLEKQTRPHKDLDVIVLCDDAQRICDCLGHAGYELKEYWSENRWIKDGQGREIATAFVLHDQAGREFDAHVMRLDPQGNGVALWAVPEDFRFEQAELAGRGIIAGDIVQCITPAAQMKCHTGYELPVQHAHDLALLQDKFAVTHPELEF